MPFEAERVKQLMNELNSYPETEVKEIAIELVDIVSEVGQLTNHGEQLALAVIAFADWQRECYKVEEATRQMVSQSLWHEVSDLVYALTGTAPSNPCARSSHTSSH